MSQLLKTDILVNSLVILFHFLNFTVGLAALFIIFRKVSIVSSQIRRSFFQQAVFYNLTLILSAVTDFLDFFFWKVVSNNIFTLSILYFINILALATYLIWALSYAQMTYNFLGITEELRKRRWFRYLFTAIMLYLAFLFIVRVLRLIPNLYFFSSLILVFAGLGTVLGYSIFIGRKSISEKILERRKALKILSNLFIAFSVTNIFVFLNFYPFNVLPPLATKFSYNVMDLMYNCLIIFWALKYLDSLNRCDESIENERSSIGSNIEKYQISKRELEIIHLVCAGKSNQEIADTLFISLGTVKNHLYNIYAKIGIKNRTQLAKLFQE